MAFILTNANGVTDGTLVISQLKERNVVSNGTMTCEINEIWSIFEDGSIGTPAQSARRKMAKVLIDMAQREDCDMHNLDEGLRRLASYKLPGERWDCVHDCDSENDYCNHAGIGET